MSINVNSIISNPDLYRNHYNNYSPTNAYYNYYDEYCNRDVRIEEERRKFEEFTKSYKKISLEEADAQIRNAWEKEKAVGKIPSTEMFFSTEIIDYDKYIEAYRKEKETRGLNNCMMPLTREEEEELREKERLIPRNIRMSSYDFIGGGYQSQASNLVYWIEGVRFSQSEYEECSSIINQARNLIPDGTLTLDYREHAILGLAYNVVSTYAKENLTWAQSQVVTQSMAAYLDTYILKEQESYERRGIIRDNNKYHNILDKETGARCISATNEEAIEALRRIFGEVDLRNQKAVNEAYKKYLAITGITGSFRDDNDLKKTLSSAKAIVNSFGKSVDCCV